MKINLTSSFISFLLFLLIITGCDNKDSIITPPQKSSVLLPLNKGNEWKYLRTIYDTSGAVISRDTIIRTISNDSLVYNSYWSFESNKEELFRNSDEGLWKFWGEPRLIYRYPAKVGTIANHLNSTSEIISIDTTISTSAGNFKCYHYSIDFFGLHYNHFISPDIGFIKVEYADFKIKTPFYWIEPYVYECDELISYNIK